MSLKVVTQEVRFSFPHLFEPHAFDTEEPKYSLMVLVPKTDETTIKKLRQAEKEAVEKGVGSVWQGKRPKDIGSIIKDGDEDGTAEDYPEREGHYYFTIRSKSRPQVVNGAKRPIQDTEEIYSGCYGRVSMNAFPYKYGGKNGVSFGLNNVQKTADGESLAGGTTADEDFDIVDEDDFDDDLM